MRSKFLPSNIPIPSITEIESYLLEPLTTKQVIEDWLVLRENADAIVKQRGEGHITSEWPHKCSLEKNYQDLTWVQYCAENRMLFSYIIRRKDTNEYAGCVYIYPIELFFEEHAEQFDVDLEFWITQREFDSGTYDEIGNMLFQWLTDEWKFPKNRIGISNNMTVRGLETKYFKNKGH